MNPGYMLSIIHSAHFSAQGLQDLCVRHQFRQDRDQADAASEKGQTALPMTLFSSSGSDFTLPPASSGSDFTDLLLQRATASAFASAQGSSYTFALGTQDGEIHIFTLDPFSGLAAGNKVIDDNVAT